MHGLRLALRAVLWRRALSLTMLLVAVVAVTAAALGPLYSRAAEQSLFSDVLTTSRVSVTGLEAGVASTVSTGQVNPDTAARMLADARQAVSASRFDAAFDAPIDQLTTGEPLAVLRPADRVVLAETRYLWRTSICEHLVLEGRCPTAVGEVAVSPGTAALLGARVGSTVLVRTPVADARPAAAAVVAIYQPRDPAEPYWYDQTLLEAGVQAGDRPERLDAFVTGRPTVDAVSGILVRAVSQRLMRTGSVRLEDTAALVADARSVAQEQSMRGSDVVMRYDFAGVFESLDEDRRAVRLAATLVTLQLVLLTWFVLFLVVAAVTEERVGEVALAKLRGFSPSGAAVFGLLEPLVILVVAVPIGLLLGVAVTKGLAAAVLLPGTPVQLRAPVLTAVLLALVGGACAAALAARRVLREPVLEQLRRTSGARPSVRRSPVVDALVVALAGAGVYQLATQPEGQGLALLTPSLLALGAALLGVRLVPLLVRGAVRRTRRTARVVPFLASRQVARRPGGLRTVVLCAVAVALATFAVDAWQVARTNRGLRADQATGAATVLHVAGAADAEALLAAVRRADPSGRRAMAVGEVIPLGAPGRIVAVDSARFAAVARWRPSWAGLSAAEVAERLHPQVPEPLVLGDGTLRLQLTGVAVTGPPLEVVARLAGRQGGERRGTVSLGGLRPGSGSYEAAITGCMSGCRLMGLTLERPPGRFEPAGGAFEIAALTADGPDGRPVAPGLSSSGRWRVPRADLRDPTAEPSAELAVKGGALRVTFANDAGQPMPLVAPNDLPDPLPAIFGRDSPPDPYPTAPGAAFGTGLDGAQVLYDVAGTAAVLPRTGRAGTLVDLEYAGRLASGPTAQLLGEVWLADGVAPADLEPALDAAGLRVTSVESVDTLRSRLDREGPALGLLLFLVAALTALVLAFLAVAATVHIGGRGRSYELAALRAIGVRPRDLVAAARREQLLLLGAGAVLGLAVGLLGAVLALPGLPQGSTAGTGPPPVYDPAWGSVALLGGLVAALVLLVASVTAHLLVRGSGPERLMQVQA